ncbi:hypothetical protein BS50DRAFT_77284 [Corynespora cassiicola Philippines]|uniref:Uncharacterized protein n=1 Tax=Corynespora cassiicola Philippines TaxID=1448308 RepID=A0A2T2NGJ8_CORCC|nr:hypothetical protein BS50DRAFT_77284 [Corynespora cassiicola Philippines]
MITTLTMMVSFAAWLLAACSSVTAGPVPDQYRRPNQPRFFIFSNTSSIVLKASSLPSASSSTLLPPMVKNSPSALPVNADTAVIIEPVQPTVITHTKPGITFLLPDGRPFITDSPQTVLSTSFLTDITPTPSSSKRPKPEASSMPVSLPYIQSSIGMGTFAPSSLIPTSQAESEKNMSGSMSYQTPMFTYSPDDRETRTSSPLTSSKQASGASTQLPSLPGGFISRVTPTSASTQNASMPITIPTHSSVLLSTKTMLSITVQTTLLSSLKTNPGTLLPETPSTIVMTLTQYTTVFPTPLVSEAPTAQSSTSPSSMLSSAPQSSSAALSSVPSQGQESTASPPGLPSTSLSVPPVVVITMYTTVAPTPPTAPEVTLSSVVSEAPPPQASSPVSSVVPSEPLSSQTRSATTSQAPEMPSFTYQPPSSVTSEASVQPPVFPSSKPAEPTLSKPAITSSKPIPSAPPPTSVEPVPEPSASSLTSEGPLIITPIPPSQIFTVTETVTEKETVTVTATVTA